MNSSPVINNYEDLQREKKRLEAQLFRQKEQLSKNIGKIKGDLEPGLSFIKLLGKLTSRNPDNKVLNTVVDYAVGLLQRTVFKRFSWPLKLILPFVSKNLASHLLGSGKEKK
ncbi:hypothetical protein [Parasediminibacterium sp. JCM 36343]|uniref:hypothetical protein n=1 Tax=Parasediminibacterium sp. JCM 36343 TaxID=3374279 RepID=UPI003978991A